MVNSLSDEVLCSPRLERPEKGTIFARKYGTVASNYHPNLKPKNEKHATSKFSKTFTEPIITPDLPIDSSYPLHQSTSKNSIIYNPNLQDHTPYHSEHSFHSLDTRSDNHTVRNLDFNKLDNFGDEYEDVIALEYEMEKEDDYIEDDDFEDGGGKSENFNFENLGREVEIEEDSYL